MSSNSRNGSRAAPARGFMALFAIVLAMGLSLMAFPAAAAPFAYVNSGGNVSVIDTATNMVVATVAPLVDSFGGRIAVTPDGKHAYALAIGNQVSVIDTVTNMVVAIVNPGGFPDGVAVSPDGKYAYVTVPSFPSSVVVIGTAGNTVVGAIPVMFGSPVEAFGIAFTPDGKHAYVTNVGFNNVWVIDTAKGAVVGTPIPVGSAPLAVAVTPDGAHAYVANSGSNNVSVIATASNTVVATIPVGNGPVEFAVAPDGTHVYVANVGSNSVSVIATASNTVVGTVPVPQGAGSLAVTPDGKHVYVTGNGNVVSVIDTATNIVKATIPVPGGADNVAIIPDAPFLAFGAALAIHFGGAPNQDAFALETRFILSSTAPHLMEPVTLQIGTFAVTIPPGSFKKTPQGFFVFAGVINGVGLEAALEPTGTLQYAFQAKAVLASLIGTTNPVTVRLNIGVDSGITPVTAKILH